MKTWKLLMTFIAIYLCSITVSFGAVNGVVDDAAVTTKVKSKIMVNSSVSVFRVGVTTKGGVVYLSGTVDSPGQAGTLVEIAESTDGVNDVNADNLRIKQSGQPVTDTYITGKVKGLFIREKVFGDREVAAMGVHVVTNNGVVHLSGNADNEQQANTAISIARSVKGVKNVISDIKITPQ